MNIEDKVRELISEELKTIDVIVDVVLYVKEDGNYFLRVVIDKKGIVDIDTCVEASRIINPILDEADLISDSYILDVTSKERGGNDEW